MRHIDLSGWKFLAVVLSRLLWMSRARTAKAVEAMAKPTSSIRGLPQPQVCTVLRVGVFVDLGLGLKI
jgi:hypothetical protein